MKLSTAQRKCLKAASDGVLYINHSGEMRTVTSLVNKGLLVWTTQWMRYAPTEKGKKTLSDPCRAERRAIQ
jgi:hypothetical protein